MYKERTDIMEKLFYTEPYLAKWESSIEDIIERDNKYYVVLDKTAFYPEGGGQPWDLGTIDGIQLSGVIEENGLIYHILSSPPQNKTVKCVLDFKRRFDLMQQHSGQHLLSAVFYNTYGGKTSSFHLGEDYISIDISLKDVSPELIKEIEDRANSYIYDNIEVKTFFIKPEEAANYPLRKVPPVTENIRIVEIGDVDFTPCCGIHVGRTGEIGMIKIIKFEKYKGITRIYFKCGMRALRDFQEKNDIILELDKRFNSPENEILTRADALLSDIDNLSKEVRDLKDRIAYYEAMEIINSASSNKISMTFNDKTFNEIQLIAKHILSNGSYLLIFASELDSRIMLSHDGGFGVNCGKIFKEHLSSFNGKGGGNDKQAQGGFHSLDDMNRFIDFLKEKVNEI